MNSNSYARYFMYSWRNTSHSRFKFLMTRVYADDSELQTIKAQPELSLSSVPCQWDSMKAGTRSNLTCLTSHAEPMVLIILRLFVFKSTPTAVSVVFTSQTDYTLKTNFHQSSSSSCQLPANPKDSEHTDINSMSSHLCSNRSSEAARQFCHRTQIKL